MRRLNTRHPLSSRLWLALNAPPTTRKLTNKQGHGEPANRPEVKTNGPEHNATNVHTPGRIETRSTGKARVFDEGGRNHHCRSRGVARRKPGLERNERRTQGKIGNFTYFPMYERAKKQPCTCRCSSVQHRRRNILGQSFPKNTLRNNEFVRAKRPTQKMKRNISEKGSDT